MARLDILVAGATGTNGKALLVELARRGITARAFVRDANKAADLEAMGHELVQGDLSDPSTILSRQYPNRDFPDRRPIRP